MRNSFQVMYDAYVISMLISVNIYFFLFVHYKSDLAPNFALLVVTLPAIIIQLKKLIRGMKDNGNKGTMERDVRCKEGS